MHLLLLSIVLVFDDLRSESGVHEIGMLRMGVSKNLSVQ